MSFSRSSNPFGGRILPWKNSIRYPSRSTDGTQLRISSSGGITISPGSTTNTSDFQLAGSFNSRLSSIDSVVKLFGSVMVKHSIADATFSLNVDIFPYVGDVAQAGLVLIDQGPMTLGAADGFVLVPLAQEFFNNHPSFSAPLYVPGKLLVAIYFKNHTAGTLTWGATGKHNTLSFLELGAYDPIP